MDERFDPVRAIDGAARYLAIAGERFGADDLAVVSYHMGIGNLESVLRAYADAGADRPIGELVADQGLSYARVYFDSSPYAHRAAYELLAGFGDESAEYLWKVRASEQVLRLYRDDPDRLSEIAELATAKATLEEVFHPEAETEVFDDPDAIEDALADGELAELPFDPGLGWVPDKQLGELAGELDRSPELYRALRPEALATLSYLAGSVLLESNEPDTVAGQQRGPRPRLPGAAARSQPRGDLRVLAAHDRVGVRHPPRIRLRGARQRRFSRRSTGSARWR